MSGDLATTDTAELKAANSASEDASTALKSSSEETPIAIDSSTSDDTSTTVAPAGPVTARTPEQVREAVRIQVEYWLSPQNLANDRYLVNQMDAEMWVSISTILGFSKMKNLTKDPNVVLQALNSSKTVKVDVANQKLQPVLQKVKRTTIIVREMPDNATNESIKSVFDKGNFVGVQSIKPDINNCWFVVFETEELAQKGLEFLRTETYEGQPIKARLKSEPVLKPATNFVYTPSTRAINAAISLQAQNTPEGVPVPVGYFPPMPPYMVPVGGRGRAYGNVNQMRGPQHPRGQYINSNNYNSSASNNNNAGNSNNNNASNNHSNSYQNHWNNAGSEGNQHNSHDKTEGRNSYGGANSAGGNAANNSSGVSGGQSRYQGSGNTGNLNQQRRKKEYQRRNIPTANTNVGGNNAGQTNSSHSSAANGSAGISQGTSGGSHNDKSSHSGSGAATANHSKDDGNSKKKRSQMTKRKGGGKQGQNVQLQLGLAHFPPLPTRGSSAGGYKEDFHKYSTEEMYRIIMALKANTSSLLPCPDVPQDHPAVLKKPTLELELEKYPIRGAPAITTEPTASAPPAESAVANPYRKSAADVVKSTPAKAATAPAKVSGKSNNAKQNTKHQNANSSNASKSTGSTSSSSQTAAEASNNGSKSSTTANAPPSNSGSSNTTNAAAVSTPNLSPSSSSTAVSAASSASSTSTTSTSASTNKQTTKSPTSSASPPASGTESSSQKQESSSKSNQDASIKSWATIVGKSSTGGTTKLSNSNEAVSNTTPPPTANSSTPVPKPSVSTTPAVEATAAAH